MGTTKIRFEADLARAHSRMDELLAANAYDSTDADVRDEFEVLSALIYYYEQRTADPKEFSLAGADVVELVKEVLYQKQISEMTAAQLLGISADELSQLLNRQQPVSRVLAKRLHQRLGIPAEALLTLPE